MDMVLRSLITTVLLNASGGALTAFVAYLAYKGVEYFLKANIQAQQLSGPFGFMQRGFGYAAGLLVGGLLAKGAWMIVSRFYLG